MERNLKKFLDRLAEELKKELENRLRSVVLYGSAVRGGFVKGRSDVNLLLVVSEVDAEVLQRIGRIFRRYRYKGFSLPVVVDEEYIKSSLDVFPIEFEEMKRHHQVIYGEDLISELKIKREDLRRELESEFKQNLLLLRGFIMEHLDFSSGLRDELFSMCRSLSAHFRVLGFLSDEFPAKDDVRRVEDLSGVNLNSIRRLFELSAERGRIGKKEGLSLVSGMLDELTELVRWIDRMNRAELNK